MREIFFKAKRIDNREWVEGTYARFYENGGKLLNVIFANFEDEKRSQPYNIDLITICQYTGLTDKNGKKIWENDIVRRTDLHNVKEPSVGFIEYDMENTAFLIHWIDVVNYSATYPWKERIEVIGNIFDNPELLEEGAE